MSEITRFDELFAEDAAVVREIIRKSGELPRLEPGAFRDGFIAGITDMAARADCAVGDGGHQLQDIAEQITMLVSGEAFLVHHPIDPVDATADKQRALIETLVKALERIEGKDSYIDSTIRSDSPNGERPVICGELGMIAARARAAAKKEGF